MNSHITRALNWAKEQGTDFKIGVPDVSAYLYFHDYTNNVLHLSEPGGAHVWFDGNTIDRIEVKLV